MAEKKRQQPLAGAAAADGTCVAETLRSVANPPATVQSFADYIKTRRVTDTPRGDFISDSQMLIRLGRFPVTAWSELDHLLWQRSACDEAKRVARRVWRAYERECVA